MYGKGFYGRHKYAAEMALDGNEEGYFVDLAKYVPPFIAELREMTGIYKAQGEQIGLLQHEMEDLFDQCFILTATWGLVRWEGLCGISTNLSLTYEHRREILMAKLRGQGTTTREMIEDTAATFSGGEVEVFEDNPNNLFIVRFIGIKGVPQNMQAFISMLEDIKPAHLAYRFEYRYTTWDELKSHAWDYIGTMTWGVLRELKEEI